MIENDTIYNNKIDEIVKNQLENLVFKCAYDKECSFIGSTQQAYEHL